MGAGNHQLEAAARSSGALAQLRWYWTLDESNPGRVGFREYARAIGHKTHRNVHKYAHGYATYMAGVGTSTSLNECIELAAMSAEKAAVTEAVAEARGITVQTARKRHGAEIRQIREMADSSSRQPHANPTDRRE